LLWTDVGRRNFGQVANAGFDILYWRVDQNVSRKLARRFLVERGHPKQHYDAGVNAVPVRTAVQFDIPLIFYAEHGESEYGGLVLDEESQRTRNLTEVLENQVGDDPRNWAADGLSERDLYPYIYPNRMDIERVGVKAFYFSYFFPWDIHKNAEFCQSEFGFKRIEPRSDASFEGYALECDVDVGEKYQTIRSAKKTDKVVDSQQEINGGSIPPTLDKSKSKLKSTIDLERNYAKLPAGTYNRDKAITAVTLTSYAKDMCNAMVGCSMEQATKDVIDAYKKILESI
ncbi:hypothetical protein LCGC14_2483220, partial [marine sediment metagenome]